MRAALVERWPQLTYVYGLMPWHTARLTPGELDAYLEQLDPLLEAQVKHGR